MHLDDFIYNYEGKFYIMNLAPHTKRLIEKRALINLFNDYDLEIIKNIENFDEIGIVEYVANGKYYIKNNRIIAED